MNDDVEKEDNEYFNEDKIHCEINNLWSEFPSKHDKDLAWVMNQKTFDTIYNKMNTFKITMPLFKYNYRVLGMPVIICENLPDVGTGKKSIILGIFK